MKKIYTLASALLLAGVLAGGMTSCNKGNQTMNVAACNSVLSDSAQLPIAYINVDSLLSNYDFAKDLNEEIVKKMEDARASVNGKAMQLEKEVNDFQRKVQTNAFLSEDRAQQEANKLQRKKDEIDQLNYKLQNELAQQQAQMNARLGDTIQVVLREYNEVKQFEFIFSNTMSDNILIAKPKYDITGEVLQILNDRYAKSKSK